MVHLIDGKSLRKRPARRATERACSSWFPKPACVDANKTAWCLPVAMLGILYQKGSLRRRIGVLAWRVCGNTAARVWWSDGTKHHSSSKACGVRQRGTAVVIVGWHCTHATQRQHGRDSGGAVAVAWGSEGHRVHRTSMRSRVGVPMVIFNFSKLLFYF